MQDLNGHEVDVYLLPSETLIYKVKVRCEKKLGRRLYGLRFQDVLLKKNCSLADYNIVFGETLEELNPYWILHHFNVTGIYPQLMSNNMCHTMQEMLIGDLRGLKAKSKKATTTRPHRRRHR